MSERLRSVLRAAVAEVLGRFCLYVKQQMQDSISSTWKRPTSQFEGSVKSLMSPNQITALGNSVMSQPLKIKTAF